MEGEFDFLLLGYDVGVFHLDAEFCGAAFEDNRCVGLGNHSNDDQNDSCEGHVDPEE